MGKMDVIAPKAVILRPRAGSSTMIGATGLRELGREEERGARGDYGAIHTERPLGGSAQVRFCDARVQQPRMAMGQEGAGPREDQRFSTW